MVRRPTTFWLAGLLLIVVGCSQSRTTPPVASKPKSQAKPPAARAEKPSLVQADTTSPAELEPPAPVVTLKVEPSEINLAPDDLGLQLLLSRDDAPDDLTSMAHWSVEPEGVVSVSERGYVRPLAAGEATIQIRHGDDQAEVSVKVAARSDRVWDFAADLVPIFTRYGCNTGGCHGKAAGQNGFHLSLFGYDPEGDFLAVTRDAAGRRVDPMEPESSLLLQKATGMVSHGGGLRFSHNSDAYNTLLRWIQDGAPHQRGETHGALQQVRVDPPDASLEAPGPRQLRVVATFEDGHERDVTRLATYASNDDMAASVDETGLANLQKRAETDVVVRYQSHIVARRLSTPIHPDSSFDFASLPRRSFIDDELFKRLERSASHPAPPPPTPPSSAASRSTSPASCPRPARSRPSSPTPTPTSAPKKVDDLMSRHEFMLFWRIKFGDLLQISRARFGDGSGPYELWLDTKLDANAPWDQMVRELLTSLGDPRDMRAGGPVNYALEGAGDPKVQAELTAQRFLGLRLKLRPVPRPPLRRLDPGRLLRPLRHFRPHRRLRPARRHHDGDAAPGPRQPRRQDRAPSHQEARRDAPPERPEGRGRARPRPTSGTRRLDHQRPEPLLRPRRLQLGLGPVLRRGIVNPPDDLSAANPPVHPELLEALASHFRENKYDIRELIRAIATSEAYALSSKPIEGNQQDNRLFSHQQARPLTAHQMADAIAQATNVPDRFPSQGLKARRKAIEIFDPGTPSAVLDTFGRCPRTNGCSPVANPELTLKQALLLIGGDAVDGKVSSLNGYLMNLLALNPPASEIIEFLYYRTLCRPPTDEELSHWTSLLESADSLQEASEDLFWALLNSREFAFNH